MVWSLRFSQPMRAVQLAVLSNPTGLTVSVTAESRTSLGFVFIRLYFSVVILIPISRVIADSPSRTKIFN